MCEMNEILEHAERYECVTCGHEWPREAAAEPADAPRVVKDAHGNVLADGDERARSLFHPPPISADSATS